MLTLSVVIVTYNRNRVLVDTIRSILEQKQDCIFFEELIIVDQTKNHDSVTQETMLAWRDNSSIRWIKLTEPDLTNAMNRGLVEAKSSIVLYVDDDILPKQGLVSGHMNAHLSHPEATIVVGQILQPRELPEDIEYTPKGSHLNRYSDFPFRSTKACYVENAMAGNMSVDRGKAIAIGGFDENFSPPVASRFESDFAKRVIKSGGKIWFEPSASIDHLAEASGGTRSQGSHFTSASPKYGVGAYYFAFKHGEGFECFAHCAQRLFRVVRTKYYLKHPWFIPIKILGEMRAIHRALVLKKKPQKLLAYIE